MNSKTELLLKIMRFFAWLVFIWFLVKAGAIIMSFGVSINNSEAAKDLYSGMDLSRYEMFNFSHYAVIVCYYIILYLLQAYTALFTTKLLNFTNTQNAVNVNTVSLLHNIKYTTLAVLVIAILHNIHVAILEKYAEIPPDFITSESIFLAGMVFVLALLFKRSLEIQLANDQ